VKYIFQIKCEGANNEKHLMHTKLDI